MKRYSLIQMRAILLSSLALFNCSTPLDIDPPKLTIISPKAEESYYSIIPIELQIDGNADRVEVFLDNQLVQTFTSEPFVADLPVSALAAKLMTFRVVAHVREGNPAEAQLSVKHAHGFKLVSPNGGEVWPARSTQDITWEWSGSVKEDVSLFCSINEGVSWVQIIGATPNTGSYAWTLPDIAEAQISCRVKVSEKNGDYIDASDDDFVINQWSPTLIGSCDVPGYPLGVFVSESHAYVTYGYGGLQIIEISNPGNPARVGSYITPGDRTWDVFVSGNYAYIADGFWGLHVINISKPNSPTLVKSYDTPGYSYGVLVSGNYAYVADGDAGLQVINVSNTANPILVGVYDTPGTAFGVFKSQNYAYVADGNAGLQIIDISNPANPSLVGTYDSPGAAHGVFVSGDYTFVADMNAGLQVVNVSNPSNPTLTGGYDTPRSAHNIFIAGNYAYVADMDGSLRIFNVADPAKPALAGVIDRLMTAMDVSVRGRYAYVTDHKKSLLIYDISGLK